MLNPLKNPQSKAVLSFKSQSEIMKMATMKVEVTPFNQSLVSDRMPLLSHSVLKGVFCYFDRRASISEQVQSSDFLILHSTELLDTTKKKAGLVKPLIHNTD